MKKLKDWIAYVQVGLILLCDDKEMWQGVGIALFSAGVFFLSVNLLMVK